MPAKKGHIKIGGRTKGTPNKLTKTVRETVLKVFNDLQEDHKANLLTWAKQNPKDFYLIASKLIPNELVGKDGEKLFDYSNLTFEQLYFLKYGKYPDN